MSLASRACAFLNQQYRIVLEHMRQGQWADQIAKPFAAAIAACGITPAAQKDPQRRGLGDISHFGIDSLEPRLLMTTLYWDTNGATPGLGGTGTWDTSSANWTTDPTGSSTPVQWQSETDAVFSGTAGTVTLTGSVSANSLSLNSGNLSVASTGSLNLAAGGTVSSGRSITNVGNITIAGTLSVAGNFSNSTLGQLNILNGGVFVVSGMLSNMGGTVNINSGGSFTSSSGSIIGNMVSSVFNINGGNVSVGGSFTNGGMGSGTINLSSGLFTVQSGGQITGYSGGMDISGGTFIISSGSSYTNNSGNILVHGGQLTVAGTFTNLGTLSTSGSGILQIGDGTTNSGSFTGNVVNNGSLVFATPGSQSVTYSGVISGSGSISKTNTGTATLEGVNTFTGGVNVGGGSLKVATGGTLNLNGGTISSGTSLYNDGTVGLNGALTSAGTFGNGYSGGGQLNINNGGALTVTGGMGNIGSTITINSGGSLTTGSGSTFSGMLYGTINVSGGSLLVGGTFNNGGMFGETINLSAGSMTLQSGSQLNNNNASAINISGGIFTVSSGATLTNNSGTSVTVSGGQLTVAGTLTNSGTLSTSGSGILQIGDGTTNKGSLTGNVVDNGSLVFATPGSQSVTYSGVISGTGNISKTYGGSATLAGVNTFTGSITVNGGSFAVAGGGVLSITGGLISSGVNFTNNGTLNSTGTLTNFNIFNNYGILNTSGTFTSPSMIYSSTINNYGTINQTGSFSTQGYFNDYGQGIWNLGNNATTTLDGAGAILTLLGTLTINTNSSFVANSGSRIMLCGTVNVAGGSLSLNNSRMIIGGLGGVPGSLNVTAGSVAVHYMGQMDIGSNYNGTVTVSGGTLTADYGSYIPINAKGTLSISGNTSTATFAGTISGNSSSIISTSTGGTLQIGDGQNYSGALTGNVINNGALTFATPSSQTVTYSGVISGSGALTKNSGGTVVLSGANTFGGSLAVNAGTLQIAAGGSSVLVVNSLAVDTSTNGGILDLTDHTLVLHQGNLGSVRSLIASGIGSGHGVTSSWVAANAARGLGYGSGSEIVGGSGTFNGQAIVSTDVIIKPTLLGDANLDGQVNASDVVAFLNNYGVTGQTFDWNQGDFTYDGQVNTADQTALLRNFDPTPAIPTTLTATPASATQITLHWTDNANTESGFLIEQSFDGVNFTQIGGTAANATSFTAGGLTPTLAYYFRIRATNAVSNSVYSASANATTLPNAPTSLTATTVSTSQINLSWTAPSGTILGYNLYRGTLADGFSTTPVNGSTLITATNYSDNSGLLDGTQYFYAVVAQGVGGASAVTTSVSATTVPLAPQVLSIEAAAANEMEISWQHATSRVDSIQAYIATFADVDQNPSADETSSIYTQLSGGTNTATGWAPVTGLTVGTDYVVRMISVKNGVKSAPMISPLAHSSSANDQEVGQQGTLLAPHITGVDSYVTAPNEVFGSINYVVTWSNSNKNSGVDRYDIEVKDDSDPNQTTRGGHATFHKIGEYWVADGDINSATFSQKILIPISYVSSEYIHWHVRVRAVRDGESAYSRPYQIVGTDIVYDTSNYVYYGDELSNPTKGNIKYPLKIGDTTVDAKLQIPGYPGYDIPFGTQYALSNGIYSSVAHGVLNNENGISYTQNAVGVGLNVAYGIPTGGVAPVIQSVTRELNGNLTFTWTPGTAALVESDLAHRYPLDVGPNYSGLMYYVYTVSGLTGFPNMGENPEATYNEDFVYGFLNPSDTGGTLQATIDGSHLDWVRDTPVGYFSGLPTNIELNRSIFGGNCWYSEYFAMRIGAMYDYDGSPMSPFIAIPMNSTTFTAKAVAQDKISLTWDNVADSETGYELQYIRDGKYINGDPAQGINWNDPDVTTFALQADQTDAQIKGMIPGETYHFRVRATGSVAPSAWKTLDYTMPATSCWKCGINKFINAVSNAFAGLLGGVSTTGEYTGSSTDVSGTSGGFLGGLTRLSTNGGLNSSANDGFSDDQAGNGMSYSAIPVLTKLGNGRLVLSSGPYHLYFDSQGNPLDSTGADLLILKEDPNDSLLITGYRVTDNEGNRLLFDGNLEFISYTDPEGNTLTPETSNEGDISYVERNAAGVLIESFSFTGGSLSGTGTGNVNSVSMKDSQGQTIQLATNYYYGANSSNGNPGDLQKVVTQTFNPTTNTALSTETTYYRYYKAGNYQGYAGAIKFVVEGADYDRLVAAMAAQPTYFASASDVDLLTDAQLSVFASTHVTYDDAGRVASLTTQGNGCSTCSGGLGTTYYGYGLSGNADGYNNWKYKTTEYLPGYDFSNPNNLENTKVISYSNYKGQIIFQVTLAPSKTEPGMDDMLQADYYHFNDQGQQFLHANSSAIAGFDETLPDLVGLKDTNATYLWTNEGLIEYTEYYNDGNKNGYVMDTAISQGYQGPQSTKYYQSYTEYTSYTVNDTTAWYANMFVSFPSEQTVSPASGLPADARITLSVYDIDNGHIIGVTQTQPRVSEQHNGPTTLTTDEGVTRTSQDSLGRTIWSQDAQGYLTFYDYTPITGLLIKTIQDVNTNLTADFDGYALPDSTWLSQVPPGSHQHLITSYEYDPQGRMIKQENPNGQVTFTVYKDDQAAPEVRSYTGHMNGGNFVLDLPVSVSREDRTHSLAKFLSVSGSSTIVADPWYYSENITYVLTAGTPLHMSGGYPVGDEAITNNSVVKLLSLSRVYTNPAGQTMASRQYFDFSNLTQADLETTADWGVRGVNYYETDYSYNSRGWLKETISPTGTINFVVYDNLGRTSSTWVGTNDTGATNANPAGSGSGNNMVKVSEYIYDNGGLGDGNLTLTLQYPGGTEAPYASEYLYDWRNRQIASKAGVVLGSYGLPDASLESTSIHRPISVSKLDNLGETTARYQFDGDGLSLLLFAGDITVSNHQTSIAPTALRAYSTAEYDEQGRVYQSATYSVDNTTGVISDYVEIDNIRYDLGIVNNTWYNLNGQVIKSTTTGQATTKTQYDGLGRVTKQFVIGQSGDALPGQTDNWEHAKNVANDVVLSQDQVSYDVVHNATLSIHKARFDTAPNTLTGELGDPTSNNTTIAASRNSYYLSYTDYVGNQIARVNLGTNGGYVNGLTHGGMNLTGALSTGEIPAAPERDGSDGITGVVDGTILLTTYESDYAHRSTTVMAPDNTLTKTFYDALGRVIYTVASWGDNYDPTTGALPPITPTTPGVLNQTTAYTYDGAGHMLTQTAVMPAGTPSQTTIYRYGVTTADNSGVNSNDLLGKVIYGSLTFSDPNSISVVVIGDAVTVTAGATTTNFDSLTELTCLILDTGTGTNPTITLDFSQATSATSPVKFRDSLYIRGTGQITVNVSGPCVLSTDLGATSAMVTVNVLTSTDTPTDVIFTASQHLLALNIAANAKVELISPTATVLMVGTLTTNALGLLNLGTNNLLVQSQSSAELATIQQLLAAGYQSTTHGIICDSDAPFGLGYLLGSDYNALYPGQTYFGTTVGSNNVVVKYTLAGDVTLDGVITGVDFAQIDAAYLSGLYVNSGATWMQGDFNYDGKVNVQDFALIDAAFDISFNHSTAAIARVSADTTRFGSPFTAAYEAALNATGPTPTSYPGPNFYNYQSYTYNALGQMLTKTDQNQTVHEYFYDALGRQILDRITQFGAGVDQTIKAIGVFYNTQGLVASITSYKVNFASILPADVANQVLRQYNGFGQLTQEYQSTNGPVITDSQYGTITLSVQYGYSDLADGVGSRLISMTYPDGSIIHYNYDGNSIDNATSRLSSITNMWGSLLEAYTYLGDGTVVARSNPVVTLSLKTGTASDSNDPYTGIDRFGRVIDQKWVNTSDGTMTDEFAYTYDKASNRVSKTNAFLSSQGINSDNYLYAYDTLNRLIDAKNNVSAGNTTGTAYQNWTLDAVGNMTQIQTAGQDDDNRVYNTLNQIAANVELYDANGNTIVDDHERNLVYDAWNRLVKVYDVDGTTLLETLGYNGLGYKVTTTTGTGETAVTTSSYYSSSWQVIEERVVDSIWPSNQYVWSPVYVDAMICRIHWVTGMGSMTVRYFVQQDANYNVTAIVYGSEVVERFTMDAYGGNIQTYTYDSGTDTWGLGTDARNWQYFHQGGRYDALSGLYNFRNRLYSPTLMRWTTMDPAGYVDGANMYLAVGDNPINGLDAQGLRVITINITIDKAKKPDNFNTANVGKKLNALFEPFFAKLKKDTIKLNVLDGQQSKNESGVLSGWIYDRYTGMDNAGWTDWIPVWGVGAKIYRACTKKPEQYNGYVTFDSEATSFYAVTSNYKTSMKTTKIETDSSAYSPIDWDQTWANLIAHEQMYLGIFDTIDKIGATKGTIESGSSKYSTPITITGDWWSKFVKFIDVE